MIIELDYSKNGYDKNGKQQCAKSLVECEICKTQRTIFRWRAAKNVKHWCKDCNKRFQKRKYLKDYIELAEKNNLELISNEIPIKTNIKVKWKAKCGHILNKSYNHVKKSSSCLYCSHENPNTLEDYLKIAEDLKLTFIGPVPKSAKTCTEWICLCGSIFNCSLWCIRKGLIVVNVVI